jgi:predicted ATPase
MIKWNNDLYLRIINIVQPENTIRAGIKKASEELDIPILSIRNRWYSNEMKALRKELENQKNPHLSPIRLIQDSTITEQLQSEINNLTSILTTLSDSIQSIVQYHSELINENHQLKIELSIVNDEYTKIVEVISKATEANKKGPYISAGA